MWWFNLLVWLPKGLFCLENPEGLLQEINIDWLIDWVLVQDHDPRRPTSFFESPLHRKAAHKEGGVDEHEQAQPRRARKEDRDEADARREEQFEPSSATRGGRELKKLKKTISTF